jgi:hypothetical protein
MAAVVLSSCFGRKPFQPPPPEYSEWVKEGVAEQNVMQAMKDCGYKDFYGYGDKTSNNEIAKQEKCMFQKGFNRKGSYKGICSLKGQEKLPACM